MAPNTWLSPPRYKLVLEVHLVRYSQHSLETDVTKIRNGMEWKARTRKPTEFPCTRHVYLIVLYQVLVLQTFIWTSRRWSPVWSVWSAVMDEL